LIAIVCSTWEEIKGIKTSLSKTEEGKGEGIRYIVGKLSDKPVLVGVTGVGIRRARKGTSFVIQKFKPDFILSVGHGGALSPSLKVGDIVIGEWVLSLKKKEKRPLVSNLTHVGDDSKKGGILTENRFIYDPREKKLLFENSGALIVDMETWGVTEAAFQSGIKVISVRSISDEYNETLPDMGSLFNSREKLDVKNTLAYFLSHPSHILPYIRFTKVNSKKTSDSLSRFLGKIIPLI
jgi:adenosylhomocysteine nucleosidase